MRCLAPGATALFVVLLAAPALGRPSAEDGLENVSAHLRAARLLGQQRVPLDRTAAALPVLEWHDGRVRVEIRFRTLAPSIVAAAQALGAEVVHASYRYARLTADIDTDLLPALAALPDVTAIHPHYGAQISAGSIASQSDALIGADLARERFAVDGTGVQVGIMSDSFNRRLGGTASGEGCERIVRNSSPQFSEDLPDTVVVLDNGPTGATDEGAALGEIVHDIAPGAGQLFASAFPSEAAFAENIAKLVECGADVLVDDVLYFAEPAFQDGIIAQATQAAVDGGVPFFSAVGNHGIGGIDDRYRDAAPDVDDMETGLGADDLHEFAAGSAFAAITLPPGCGLRFILQWEEPFSGTLGPGASSDLDLYVLDGPDAEARILANASDSQGCGDGDGTPRGDPLEITSFTNSSGRARTVYVAVDHFCGNENLRFRLITFPPNLLSCRDSDSYVFDAEIFTGAQAYGHPAAAGAVAVAASFFGEIETGGDLLGPPAVIDVNPYSARGGDLVLPFDRTGQPLPGGPSVRFKPELTAPDGINSTFFGVDSDYDADAVRNFAGTSAAAPHVAAVAALMRQLDPGLSPAGLVALLRATSRDIAVSGRDDLSGDGLLDAEAALAALASGIPTPTVTPTATQTAEVTATATMLPVPGDCDGGGAVTIEELITAVNIALDRLQTSACEAADRDTDGRVGIAELIGAVAAALGSAVAAQ
jgi:subtilisin family serine protease